MMVTKSPPTDTRNSLAPLNAEERVRGFLRVVDVDQRDIVVMLPTGLEEFFVPPNCPILLHGERIKLRLIQVGDEVCVTCVRYGETRNVKVLEIQPND